MPEDRDKKQESGSEKKPASKNPASVKVVMIRIRGSINTVREIENTLNMLKLYKKNNCVIVEMTPSIKGMIKKINNFITWGEIDDETLAALNKKGDMVPCRLNPPVKGYGRKGIKVPFSRGGALGYRGERINELIQRMI